VAFPFEPSGVAGQIATFSRVFLKELFAVGSLLFLPLFVFLSLTQVNILATAISEMQVRRRFEYEPFPLT